MEALIVILVVAVVGAAVAVVIRATGRGETTDVPMPGAVIEDGTVVVTLEVGEVDSSNPAVQRLVEDAANRALDAAPGVTRAEVRDREGVTLGTRERDEPLRIDLPEQLSEPRARKQGGPDVVREGSMEGAIPTRGERVEPPEPPEPGEEPAPGPAPAARKGLLEHLEIPPEVREHLRDPDDLVDLVRAILTTSGAQPVVDDDVVRVGDRALVVMRAGVGAFVDPNALNQAYARFKDSRARSGVVVTVGSLNVHDLRRRQMLEPNLLHAGPDGIQRMADAAAVGADPIAFAATPVAQE